MQKSTFFSSLLHKKLTFFLDVSGWFETSWISVLLTSVSADFFCFNKLIIVRLRPAASFCVGASPLETFSRFFLAFLEFLTCIVIVASLHVDKISIVIKRYFTCPSHCVITLLPNCFSRSHLKKFNFLDKILRVTCFIRASEQLLNVWKSRLEKFYWEVKLKIFWRFLIRLILEILRVTCSTGIQERVRQVYKKWR